MRASKISALRDAEFACGFDFVCAGSALQSSERSLVGNDGIHHVKQRSDCTTIGAVCLTTLLRLNSGVCSGILRDARA